MLDAHTFTWNYYSKQHNLRSHATDDYPRLLFTKGISGLNQLKADDKVGIFFALVIALVQVERKSILLDKTVLNKTRYKNILYIFKKMLAYWGWLKRSKFWKKNDKEVLKAAEKAIEFFLAEIIKYMPRTQGNNWEICKIHKQLHVAENINFLWCTS